MNKQRGAVSIFLVVFTALLVVIVTTSFVQLMLRNQQQASNNDLSQSAFDSALAGVEDAKRALVRFKECLSTPSDSYCSNLISTLRSETQSCDMLDQANIVTFSGGEVRVGDVNANQAYTCVKIDVTTNSYIGFLDAPDDQVLIPLETVAPASEIGQIRVSWFSACDVSTPDPLNPSAPCTSPTAPPAPPAAPAGVLPQPTAANWPANKPPILRTQLIQYDGALNLDGFNQAGTDMANTLFLYPSRIGTTQLHFDDDERRELVGGNPPASNVPKEVRCYTNFTTAGLDGYSCQTMIEMPSTPMPNRKAFLHLASIYNKTHFKVELCRSTCNPGDILDFDAVQPRVDSTGRANSLFRRLDAKIFLSPSGGPTLSMPSAALSLKNNLCKDMFVTNVASDYTDNADGVTCNPAG